jgi:2-iminobutanoate/2-iminopropanoate deaminase
MGAMTTLQHLFEIYPADPRATMPAGLRVDGTVFAQVDGVDALSGQAPPTDVHGQLRAALLRLRHVIESGGATWEGVERVTAYVHPNLDLAEVVAAWEALAPEMASAELDVRPAHLPAGRMVSLEALASVDGAAVAGETVALDDAATAAAVRMGPVLYVPGLTGADPASGIMPGDMASQVRAAFDNLERLLETAGVPATQLLRITGYMRDLKDKDLLNNEMVSRFPVWAQKPVHKYVPATLPEGVEFALQAIAVEGGERRILEIEGIKHNDPISLGAQVGNVFVSSRVQARLEPTAREQAARLIESHARRLVEAIGGSLDDVTQMVWGIGDPAFEADVRAECERPWPHSRSPRIDIMLANFPHSPLPRLEFFALLGSGSPEPDAP